MLLAAWNKLKATLSSRSSSKTMAKTFQPEPLRAGRCAGNGEMTGGGRFTGGGGVPGEGDPV